MTDLTERLIAMRDHKGPGAHLGHPLDRGTLAEAVNELVELEQARDEARAQRDVAQRNYLATNDAYARKAREHENELVRARAAEARADRYREALKEVLDGWGEAVESDNSTRFESALAAARAALHPEEGESP